MPHVTTAEILDARDNAVSYIQLNSPPRLKTFYLQLPCDVRALTKFARAKYRLKLGLDYHVYTIGPRVLVLRPRSVVWETWLHDLAEAARFYGIITADRVVLIRAYHEP